MRVVENSKDYLDDFIRLNEAWISSFFEIEEADRELAKNPYSIVEKGGYIFSLLDNEKVVGVCALFNDGDGVFELARMAVSAHEQGKGYGKLLIQAALNKLEKINANKVFLISNTKLEPAIALYRQYGFHTVMQGQHPIYARANIVMEKIMNSTKEQVI